MPQDPSKFRNEDDFRRSLYNVAKPSVVPKPKGRDTRITATSGSSASFAQFPNRAAAVAELNRLKQFDPTKGDSDFDGPFKGTTSALRKRDAWVDPVDTGYPIDPENKKARAMGFTSVVDYMGALQNAIDGYDKTLTKQKDYGTTALGGIQGAYPGQSKMSKALGVTNEKAGKK
jgi:hypothetical protein